LDAGDLVVVVEDRVDSSAWLKPATIVAAVHDLGLFLWFTWPVAMPWYAFKTRGRSGWTLALGLIALCASSYIAGGLAMWLVHGW
jgi:hypothetical protein